MQMIGGNGGNQFRQYARQNAANLNGYNDNQIRNGNLVAVRAERNVAGQNGNQIRCYNCRGFGHYARNCTARPRRRDDAYLQTQLLIAQKEEAGIQLQAEEYDLIAAAADLDEIEEATGVEQDGETVEQHSTNFEDTRALYESLYQNLAVEVEKV
nr:Gag-Pol polyprotein [Tanacetum cinerariifolium]